MNQERVKRKLSAILRADVVGYSRLMGEDEVSTVRTFGFGYQATGLGRATLCY